MSTFKNVDDYRNTYLGYLPSELISLIITKDNLINLLSLFRNPEQLFKSWFNLN